LTPAALHDMICRELPDPDAAMTSGLRARNLFLQLNILVMPTGAIARSS
jgi:hypothetical protein